MQEAAPRAGAASRYPRLPEIGEGYFTSQIRVKAFFAQVSW